MTKTTDFNSVHGLATRSTNLQMTNCPLSGHGHGQVANFRISHPWNIFGTAKASRQILCGCRLYRVLAFGQLTIPKKGMARVKW